MDNFFQNEMVSSQRIIYTASSFAHTSLLYLQEVGQLTAIRPHISARSNLSSYLFFVVTDGSGWLEYDGVHYDLSSGCAVFIDCRKPYSQSSSDALWKIQWCHYNGANATSIYQKFKERGGYNVFQPTDFSSYVRLLDELYSLAGADCYTRDMQIFQRLATLTTMLMEESWHPEARKASQQKTDIQKIKDYVDANFMQSLTLESLAKIFYLSKHYLARCFKEQFGVTVTSYIQQVRITKAKELLRFSDRSIEAIAIETGFSEPNYFSRCFRKVEGCSPSEYRRGWRSGSKSGNQRGSHNP